MSSVFQIGDDLGPARVIHVQQAALGLKGILVVDNIAARPTGSMGGHRDVPIEPIVIISASRGEDVSVSLSSD